MMIFKLIVALLVDLILDILDATKRILKIKSPSKM